MVLFLLYAIAYYRMAIRDVKPFDEKQMKQLHESMKKGSSIEQAKKISDARTRAEKIHRVNF